MWLQILLPFMLSCVLIEPKALFIIVLVVVFSAVANKQEGSGE
jgi:hypothetical protein